jgi:L-seryl-tRNA(Ser) seleniumtransferase
MLGGSRFSRREWLGQGSLLAALSSLFRGAAAAAPPAPAAPAVPAAGLRLGPELYQSIGVRPLVNARGTYTIISGSTLLPEVRAAMAEASQHYVQLDELTDKIGARLAELTKAEWGLVTSGCAAALMHATAACVAGGNPDLHVRIPDLRGFPRDEVIIPKHSRNVYDAAVRAVGVRVIEVSSAAERDAAFGPRTAMVYIFAGPNADEGPLSTKAMAEIANRRGVPVLVDAAAEILTVPNVHLQAGATLVGYSGGKCLRGPQSAGMLIGRKDLVRAAWVHSAPHHGFARSTKVGKEEAMGMLMAVEMWMKRDHKAEWNLWLSWLDHVSRRVTAIGGVTTSIAQPEGLSNRTPTLVIQWDRERVGLTGGEVARLLYDSTPRVATLREGGTEKGTLTGLSVNPYMMAPGDEKVVADRLYAVLSSPPGPRAKAVAAASADLSGEWNVNIEFAAGSSTHYLSLWQQGTRIEGSHRGNFVSRDLSGSIDGEAVRLSSSYDEEHGDALSFTFTGKVTGDQMSGTLDMGEYLGATWTATRHAAAKA